ncbi:RhoGAP-domain-containing protein [Wilcoxina mikolae CBS 423.85]|nr:RhoGAP-domain-containing protein [Wilcoxina mikolae CBS 423.85]
MDSPPGSPLLGDEDIIPCKGCGDILEEGKAFELAGNRWHIDCFRCNSCGTLLDSDANLLLLGDGSLICNSCTYSCTACGNKIEDLAILTGDQAFCAGCFRCRNCKRKIENLKYARTSQGIFCMSCHETLMTRRKKRPKPNQRTPTSSSNSASPMLALDKSLPSLPLSARPRHQAPKPNSLKSSTTPDQLSPVAFQPSPDHLRTPRINKRHSQVSQLSLDPSLTSGAQEPYAAFIPVVLDTYPGPSLGSHSKPVVERGQQSSVEHHRAEWEQTNPRPSYDRKILNQSSHYDAERERSARPHIATQDRSYELQIGIDKNDIPRKSHDSERLVEKSVNSADSSIYKTEAQTAKDNLRSRDTEIGSRLNKNFGADLTSGAFKLKEVPRERKRSVSLLRSPEADELNEKSGSLSPSISRADSSRTATGANPPPRGDSYRPPQSRADSPVSGLSTRNKSFENPVTSASSSGRSQHSHAASGASNTSVGKIDSPEITIKSPEKNDESPPITVSPSRRPSTAQESSFSPISESNTSEASTKSPPLGFDDELKRVFGNSDPTTRRPSGPAKHGRSLSEATRRSPGSGAYMQPFGDIGRPMSPDSKDEAASLRQELRRSTQRIVELEAKLNSTASAKALEHNIQEKRNTVALLETEREAFLRELMVIKERLDASKDGYSLDPDELKSDLIRGLTRELEDLKATLKADIQALVAQRDQLMEDAENFGRLREQAIQETEQLNIKNAQLADLNNELTRRIQGQFKANKHQVPGLGIYDASNSDLLDIKDLDKRSKIDASAALATIGMPYNETSDGTEVLVAQKVSTFKNGAQQKKFFWKKPGASIMKNAGKLSNRVFANENQMDGTNGVDGQNFRNQVGTQDTPGGGKLFGGTQKKWGKNKGGANGTNGGLSSDNGGYGTLAMFGGDLELRTAFEGAKIPMVVQKCIQEVEMRGMDYEGIYRKSGGALQMRQIQDEFERGDDVQFGPDLDICSVTSILKQYFRNLPNPLITYELYDRFIDTTNIYDEEKRVETLKAIIEELPQSHRDVLQFIIFHLARVAARKEENLMNTRNLAVVFAPSLLRHLSDEREMSDMHTKNNAIQFLIDYNETIF